ncbi:MAG: TrpB-like pyridoxal phosphate-dependent enzyme [Fimbriimonadaceae bacterium]|nr:TrpB-like pyridoxal phosphate-dependent enzyme [Fimbriimonadaceae bacterium]
MSERRRFLLTEDQIPTTWFNVKPHLDVPPPAPLHPGTGQPIGPDDLAPLFPMGLILQEVTQEPTVDIPGDVLDVYKIWRPTPLVRAINLEKALDTPARIYYKYEGTSPVGSHKPNTAVPQAYYNKLEGRLRLTTETGAGQWGSSLAMACAHFGQTCDVWMVKVSYHQKPGRRVLMNSFGASVRPSPSDETEAGRKVLAMDPDSPGSLGIAISEAVEAAAKDPGASYSLGSVLDHVILHQTVVGQELEQQLAMAGVEPDILIGCVGGGSNFAGFAFPFIPLKKKSRPDLRLVAVEPAACPSITKGAYAYDFGDLVGLTPLLKMHTLGSQYVPPPVHAGGLRYHAMAPLVSAAVAEGLVEAQAYHQTEVFEAAMLFTKTEGILPAPESSHAVKGAVVEALRAKEEGRSKTIIFNLSGHGYFDTSSYEAYLSGKLEDYAYPEAEIAAAMAQLPQV